jgi:hypothetical protein
MTATMNLTLTATPPGAGQGIECRLSVDATAMCNPTPPEDLGIAWRGLVEAHRRRAGMPQTGAYYTYQVRMIQAGEEPISIDEWCRMDQPPL